MRLDLNDMLSQKQDIQAEAEQMPRGSNILTYLSKESEQAKRGCSLGRALDKSMRKSQRSWQWPKYVGLYPP